VAPAAFVAIERWWPSIFPYSLGLTQYRQLAVAQAAELGGPSVVTFLLVLCGAALARAGLALRARAPVPWASLAAAGAAVAAALVFGLVRLEAVREARAGAPTLRVGMVQPDAVRRGWSRPPADPGALARYQRLTARLEARAERRPVDLLLWPEKGYPLVLRQDARRDFPEASARRVRRGFAAPLIFGLTSVDPRTREIGNSAAFLGRDGALEVFYDKVRLILYSEWLPGWAAGWAGGGLRYRPGARLAPLRLDVAAREGAPARRVPIAVLICFEAAFPGHVRALVARGPRLLVNLTDDAWFGDTAEPEQHLSHVVFRAIESRRDVARSTATGVSALVAATGEIVERTAVSRRVSDTTLVVEARLLSAAGAYARLGDAFAAACALLASIAAAAAWRRR